VVHDNLAFVGSIMGFFTTDRRRATSIDSKFKVENWVLDASRIKTVPMGLDDGNNRGTNSRVDVGVNDKILFKFREVTLSIPKVNISTGVREWGWWMANSFAITLEEEDALVNIVAVVHRNVAVSRFGAPHFGRNIDDKSVSRTSGRVSSRGSRR
jgi:hypothetical protein